jgi:hypothetical protein
MDHKQDRRTEYCKENGGAGEGRVGSLTVARLGVFLIEGQVSQ